MDFTKAVVFASLIIANMIVWYEASGLAGIAVFLVALLLFISWRKRRKS